MRHTNLSDWALIVMYKRKRRQKKPILVTGALRSGTTWVGKMLTLPPDIYYIPEIFHPDNISGLCAVPFNRHFQYIHPGNESSYLSTVGDALSLNYPLFENWRHSTTAIARIRVLKRFFGHTVRRFITHPRILDKDPVALMSAEWLHIQFDMEIVVLIRHPAAFVGSVKRLGWPISARGFLRQEALMRDHLSPFEAEIRRSPSGLVDQAILVWRILHYMVNKYRQKWPGWTYVRHEDLSLDPVQGFRDLFARLGIEYTQQVRQEIISHSADSNPPEAPHGVVHQLRLNSRANIKSWKNRLSEEEITRIRDGTADIYYSFYSDKDWE